MKREYVGGTENCALFPLNGGYSRAVATPHALIACKTVAGYQPSLPQAQ
jgi:hypothetical protein